MSGPIKAPKTAPIVEEQITEQLFYSNNHNVPGFDCEANELYKHCKWDLCSVYLFINMEEILLHRYPFFLQLYQQTF